MKRYIKNINHLSADDLKKILNVEENVDASKNITTLFNSNELKGFDENSHISLRKANIADGLLFSAGNSLWLGNVSLDVSTDRYLELIKNEVILNVLAKSFKETSRDIIFTIGDRKFDLLKDLESDDNYNIDLFSDNI